MFCAIAYDDLCGAIIQVVIGSKLLRNRLTQFRDASAGRVFGKAGLQRLDRGLFYVLGCIEVRFACAETADIYALGFHGFGFAIDRESKRRAQLSGAFGNFHRSRAGCGMVQNGAQTMSADRSFQSEV